jgi:hypothetical protein
LNAPIIDLRSSVPLHRRLPVGLGTLALWTLWGAAIRHVMGGLLLGGGAGSLLLLGVVLAARLRPRRQPAAAPRLPAAPPERGPVSSPQLAMGQPFGLTEVELFRARHSAICTVFHDESGAIQKLVCHVQGEALNRPVRLLPLDRQERSAWMETYPGLQDAHSSG